MTVKCTQHIVQTKLANRFLIFSTLSKWNCANCSKLFQIFVFVEVERLLVIWVSWAIQNCIELKWFFKWRVIFFCTSSHSCRILLFVISCLLLYTSTLPWFPSNKSLYLLAWESMQQQQCRNKKNPLILLVLHFLHVFFFFFYSFFFFLFLFEVLKWWISLQCSVSEWQSSVMDWYWRTKF